MSLGTGITAPYYTQLHCLMRMALCVLSIYCVCKQLYPGILVFKQVCDSTHPAKPRRVGRLLHLGPPPRILAPRQPPAISRCASIRER